MHYIFTGRGYGQGYVFTRVCDSVHRWVSGQGEPPRAGRTPSGQGDPPFPRAGRTPLGADPPGRENPPGADPPGKHTPAYGQRAAGTHPTGMHSCFANDYSALG